MNAIVTIVPLLMEGSRVGNVSLSWTSPSEIRFSNSRKVEEPPARGRRADSRHKHDTNINDMADGDSQYESTISFVVGNGKVDLVSRGEITLLLFRLNYDPETEMMVIALVKSIFDESSDSDIGLILSNHEEDLGYLGLFQILHISRMTCTFVSRLDCDGDFVVSRLIPGIYVLR